MKVNKMKSWKEVRDYITENYEISDYDEDDDNITAMVFIKNGRTQTAVVTRREKMIVFGSVIGNINKNDIKDALCDLAEYRYGRIFCTEDGECLVSHIEELEKLSEENIDVILKTVALCADVMEEKYICDDVY